ncbi:MAG: hypothetical protein IJY53_07280 [Akkermansia sp.]|nr:hypothetical protein [Akkermansia sp.]
MDELDFTLLEVPDTVAMFALGDGQVALCTYNSLHQVCAWHRWVTEGRVLSVCAPPAASPPSITLKRAATSSIFSASDKKAPKVPAIAFFKLLRLFKKESKTIELKP